MVDMKYANAYSEVLEILNYIPQADYEKIPSNMLELFKTNNNKEYKFSYDINKTLDEQNVSAKAKTIIAILFRDYWATDMQKEKILAKEKYDTQIKEDCLRERYNPEDVFKNRQNVFENEIDSGESILLIKCEEPKLFYKLLRRLIRFFKMK